MYDLAAGKLLIADPFLRDPNFLRSVVFLCEHTEMGSFGFVLNKIYDQTLGDLLTELEESTIPVYYGGPVQMDSLHYLHTCPQEIPGGIEVIDGIYWGGDFAATLDAIQSKSISEKDIRFFIGYSGWGKGQLEEEMKEKSWITNDGSKKIVFPADINNTWKYALKQLGGEYAQMVNYPIDPQLN